MSRLQPSLLGAVLAAAACATLPPEIQTALDEAKANLGTPEGREYDRRFGERFGPDFVAALESCACDLRRPSRRGAVFLFRIDASGAQVEERIHPSTKLSECIGERLPELTLAPPPDGDYWLLFELGTPDQAETPRPEYPPHLGERGIEGYAVVEFAITADGQVRAPTILESHPGTGFDESVLQAVGQWRFEPGIHRARTTESRRHSLFLFCLHSSQVRLPRFDGCRSPRNQREFSQALRRRLGLCGPPAAAEPGP